MSIENQRFARVKIAFLVLFSSFFMLSCTVLYETGLPFHINRHLLSYASAMLFHIKRETILYETKKFSLTTKTRKLRDGLVKGLKRGQPQNQSVSKTKKKLTFCIFECCEKLFVFAIQNNQQKHHD